VGRPARARGKRRAAEATHRKQGLLLDIRTVLDYPTLLIAKALAAMDATARILNLLDRWRHLPDYQLERRADIFFATYLVDFLADRQGVQVNPLLVPEFPVHIGTIYPHIPSNKSFKIDYVAFASDLSRAWFVELKTDSSSRRDKQNAYLEAAQQAGLPALLDGLLQIVAATEAKHKYCCLLRLLEQLTLVELPPDLNDALQSRHWASAVNGCLPRVKNVAPAIPVEVLFLQPVSNAPEEIGFVELADWLDGREAVADRFAASLRDWATVKAGQLTTGWS
jgi:hypothetical protein